MERIDFDRGGTGPGYTDFSPGRPLTGTVTIRSGQRLVGRLVYDLDESETTQTLDAPAHGVDYTIPFELIVSVEVSGSSAHALVSLRSGEEVRLERAGDLADGNAGMLVFIDGRESPEYVSWSNVARIDFDPSH